MTARQISRFKSRLETKKAELTSRLQSDRARLVASDAVDPMDRVRHLAERDVAIGRLDLEFAMLRRVEGALKEIHDGTFGRCAACDGVIPLKRLEAVPWSPYCVSCQETAEARGLRAYGPENDNVRERTAAG